MEFWDSMKNTILGILGVFIAIYTIAIGMEAYNAQVRKNQLDNTVSRVVQEVLEAHYTGNDTQARQNLEERIHDSLHSDAEIKIEILALDMEKGIISIIVTEEYRQMNGNIRTESVSKTAIVEMCVESSA